MLIILFLKYIYDILYGCLFEPGHNLRAHSLFLTERSIKSGNQRQVLLPHMFYDTINLFCAAELRSIVYTYDQFDQSV